MNDRVTITVDLPNLQELRQFLQELQSVLNQLRHLRDQFQQQGFVGGQVAGAPTNQPFTINPNQVVINTPQVTFNGGIITINQPSGTGASPASVPSTPTILGPNGQPWQSQPTGTPNAPTSGQPMSTQNITINAPNVTINAPNVTVNAGAVGGGDGGSGGGSGGSGGGGGDQSQSGSGGRGRQGNAPSGLPNAQVGNFWEMLLNYLGFGSAVRFAGFATAFTSSVASSWRRYVRRIPISRRRVMFSRIRRRLQSLGLGRLAPVAAGALGVLPSGVGVLGAMGLTGTTAVAAAGIIAAVAGALVEAGRMYVASEQTRFAGAMASLSGVGGIQPADIVLRPLESSILANLPFVKEFLEMLGTRYRAQERLAILGRFYENFAMEMPDFRGLPTALTDPMRLEMLLSSLPVPVQQMLTSLSMQRYPSEALRGFAARAAEIRARVEADMYEAYRNAARERIRARFRREGRVFPTPDEEERAIDEELARENIMPSDVSALVNEVTTRTAQAVMEVMGRPTFIRRMGLGTGALDIALETERQLAVFAGQFTSPLFETIPTRLERELVLNAARDIATRRATIGLEREEASIAQTYLQLAAFTPDMSIERVRAELERALRRQAVALAETRMIEARVRASFDTLSRETELALEAARLQAESAYYRAGATLEEYEFGVLRAVGQESITRAMVTREYARGYAPDRYVSASVDALERQVELINASIRNLEQRFFAGELQRVQFQTQVNQLRLQQIQLLTQAGYIQPTVGMEVAVAQAGIPLSLVSLTPIPLETVLGAYGQLQQVGSDRLAQLIAYRQELTARGLWTPYAESVWLRQYQQALQDYYQAGAGAEVYAIQLRTAQLARGVSEAELAFRYGQMRDMTAAMPEFRALYESRASMIREQQQMLAERVYIGEIQREEYERRINELEQQLLSLQAAAGVIPETPTRQAERTLQSAMLQIMRTTFAGWGDIRGALQQMMQLGIGRVAELRENFMNMPEEVRANPEAQLRYIQALASELTGLASLQQQLEQGWLDRLISQVFNAGGNFDLVARQFTMREASMFYNIYPAAFGGTLEQTRYWREQIPLLYASLFGMTNLPEGMLTTAGAIAQTASVDLNITVRVEREGNPIIESTRVVVPTGNNQQQFVDIPIRVGVNAQ